MEYAIKENSYRNQVETRKFINLNIIKNILQSEKSPINFEKFYYQVNLLSNKKKKSKDIIHFLQGINLTYLFPNTKINEPFDCYFFKNNLAWISESDNHYRYFSKSFNGTIISLDLIDLTMLYYDFDDSIKAMNKLIKNINVVSINSYWIKTQTCKYDENINFIKNIDTFENQYTYLYKIIYKHLNIIEILNNIAFKNLLSQKMSYKKEAIFFASSSYIAQKANISRSKIIKVINFLCLVGIITKVPNEQIPKNMLSKSIRIAKEKNLKDIVNYYSIIDIAKNSETLNIKAKEIYNTPIRYSSISKDLIIEYFGDKEANIVYPTKY